MMETIRGWRRFLNVIDTLLLILIVLITITYFLISSIVRFTIPLFRLSLEYHVLFDEELMTENENSDPVLYLSS